MTQPAQYISGRTVQEQMNELISYVDTRAAEVATDAIASDVAQVHQDMLDADADAQAAAASAAAAAGTLANAVKKTGEASQSIAGDIAVSGALSGGSIATSGTATFNGTTTVPTPVNNTDAATKKYVDDSLDSYAPMVRTANAQIVSGEKTLTSIAKGDIVLYEGGVVPFISTTVRTNYYNILEITPSSRTHYRILISGGQNNNTVSIAEIEIVFGSANAVNYSVIYNRSTNPGRAIQIKITRSTDNNKIRLWVLEAQFIVFRAYILRATNNGSIIYENDFSSPGTILADPTTQADYQSTVTAINLMDYPIE